MLLEELPPDSMKTMSMKENMTSDMWQIVDHPAWYSIQCDGKQTALHDGTVRHTNRRSPTFQVIVAFI